MDRTQPLDLVKMELDNKKLHHHQVKATKALDQYFDLNQNIGSKSGVLVMPTGSGKTFTAVNWLLDRGFSNGYKIIWLVHRQELIEQADATFRKQSPILLKHGKNKVRILPISGNHYSMSAASRYDIYVCSIGSVASKNGMKYISRMLGKNGREKLIVVIDEAHHAVSPSYQKVLKKITKFNPNRLLLGLTATPTRMQENEKKQLFKTFEANTNGYIYEVTLKELLTNGFLARPIYKRIETQIDGEVEFQIKPEDEAYFAKFGELSEQIKEQIAKSSSRNEVIVKEYITNKNKYGKTLVFAVNRLHAVTLAKTFVDAGVTCDYCISGEPDAHEKIWSFKEGKFEVLINVQILTEGSDVPDIQTIFLTRQTNSDSLLMQMIGRGLRGQDAGGTETAYIVDFHDTWERFNFWLDPRELLISEFGDIEDIENIEDKKEVEELEEKISKDKQEGLDYNLWDLYLKIYSAMKTNAMGLSHGEVFPHGWYSVVDKDGQDTKALVFDNQLAGYEAIHTDINNILKRKLSPQRVVKDYFDCIDNIPKVEEIELVLEMVHDTSEMPSYFTFDERSKVDKKIIAKELIEMDLRRSEEIKYLEDKYRAFPILKELYKSLDMFKASVLQETQRIAQNPLSNDVISIDEREDFNIIDDYYDLKELLIEIASEAKEKIHFEVRVIPEIRWSRKPLRSRYGMCIRHEDGSFSITINKLLCSPNVPGEVVKFVIYHELLHANGYWGHNENFRSQEWKYPNTDELAGFLGELFYRYKIDEIIPPRKVQSRM